MKKSQFLFSLLWISLFLIFLHLLNICILNFCIIFLDEKVGRFLNFVKWQVIFLIVVGIGASVRNFVPQLQKQRINDQPSWVLYAYIGVLNLITFHLCFGIYYEKSKDVFFYLFIFFSTFLIGLILYRLINPKSIHQEWRFAPGTKGIEKDEFGFVQTAKNACEGIKKLEEHVNVIVVNGEMGYGKSTFVRMIVESFDWREILYTYISLTETNEARDFSRLFSERWFETLSQRYPVLNVSSTITMMNSILRETGNGFFSELLNGLSKCDLPLLKTTARVFDKSALIRQPSFVSYEIGKAFGNIPQFGEKLWIIVVDEIERSPLEEVFRLIEIIERLKNEGRNGLPLRIVFILCMVSDFNSSLDQCLNRNEYAGLIKQFLFGNPKCITQHLPLPPVEKTRIKNMIIKNIQHIESKHNIRILPINQVDRDELVRITASTLKPEENFLDDISALGWIIDILADESFRTVIRCFEEADFFYHRFLNVKGIARKEAIRACDILVLSYLQVMHENLINFYIKTVNKHTTLSADLDTDYMLHYMATKRRIEEKWKLTDWIAESLKIDKNKLDIELVNKLIGASAHFYIDFYSGRDETRLTAEQRDNSTSYAPRLKEYLMGVAEAVVDPYKRPVEIYRNHRDGNINISELENGDLIQYSRFLRSVKGANLNLNLDIAEEIHRRLIESKIPLQPKTLGRDSIRYQSIHEFSFQLLSVIEAQRGGRRAGEETKRATSLFVTILKSDTIDTGAKYILLNLYANNERGGGSDIHFRLKLAFEEMLKLDKENILASIKHVFNEVDSRYLSGDKIIYEYEENFIYLLYQGWSGDPNNTQEIRMIREAAMRGLDKYPDAVEKYWDRFPYHEGAGNINEAIEDERFFGIEKIELYMPLNNLISITEKINFEGKRLKSKIAFWNKMAQDPEEMQLYHRICALQPSTDTLRSVLIKSGLL